MKKETKDIIDKEVLKSKVRFYIIFAIPLLLIGILFTGFFPISSSSLEVTAFKYTAKQTEYGNIPIMWAKLDSGTTIKISMPNNVELKQNKKAEITKTNTIIGISTYKFVRYVN